MQICTLPQGDNHSSTPSLGFYPCNATLALVYDLAILCVSRVLCIKRAKCFVEILSPTDSPIILDFRHRESLLNSDGFILNGRNKYRGRELENWTIFDQ